MIPLLETDLKLLRALDTRRDWMTTANAAQIAGLPYLHGHGARRRKDMLHLRELGLVMAWDRRKPTVWLRTPAGTAALLEYEEDGRC